MTPFSLRESRLTRASTKRSRILTMTPRCFLAIGGSGPRRTGGEIFSNVKAGIVYPLVVELKHPWISPDLAGTSTDHGDLFHPLLPEHDLFGEPLSTFPDHALARMKSFKHRLCQM